MHFAVPIETIGELAPQLAPVDEKNAEPLVPRGLVILGSIIITNKFS